MPIASPFCHWVVMLLPLYFLKHPKIHFLDKRTLSARQISTNLKHSRCLDNLSKLAPLTKLQGPKSRQKAEIFRRAFVIYDHFTRSNKSCLWYLVNQQPFLEMLLYFNLFSTKKQRKRFQSPCPCKLSRRFRIGSNTVMVLLACWIISSSVLCFHSETCPYTWNGCLELRNIQLLNTQPRVWRDHRITHFPKAILDKRQKTTTWNAYVNASVDVIFHAHVVALPLQNMSARRKTTTASLPVFVVF